VEAVVTMAAAMVTLTIPILTLCRN